MELQCLASVVASIVLTVSCIASASNGGCEYIDCSEYTENNVKMQDPVIDECHHGYYCQCSTPSSSATRVRCSRKYWLFGEYMWYDETAKKCKSNDEVTCHGFITTTVTTETTPTTEPTTQSTTTPTTVSPTTPTTVTTTTTTIQTTLSTETTTLPTTLTTSRKLNPTTMTNATESTTTTTEQTTTTTDADVSTSTVSTTTEAYIFKCPQPYNPSKPYLYADPADCSKFFSCGPGLKKGILMSCSTGLYFNPTLLVCDWPSNVDC